jgi:predicted metalloprotease with PDZ domain
MKRALLLVLLLPVLVSAQEAAAPPVAVTYTLDITQPKTGTAKVEMLVENNRDDEVTLGIPVWAPGSYRVVDYYLGVQDLTAEIGGKKVEVTSTGQPSLWKVKTGGAPKFKVRYTLKPSAVPPLRGHLTEEHYDLQGPSAWLFVHNRLDGPHKVIFKLPAEWRVGTGLKKSGTATYEARDYDTFIDCPVELGKFSVQTFQHDGVSYEIVLHVTEDFAVGKLVDACRKIVSEQTRMFGGAPFDRYVFIYHFRDQPGGAGLEHLNSTHITFNMGRVKENPLSVASITSHEFFHLWNVKRIRPMELGPFDYTRPVHSKALWLSEGCTSYYGDLTLARAGVWSREVYLAHLAREVGELQANDVRKTQSVEDSSWTVWDRPRGDRSTSIDYYNKGELLGWLLDLKIRHATGGAKSFDDVMRYLYRTLVVEPSAAGKGPIGIGFEEGGILKAVNEVTGKDFKDFFARYVAGTDELPYGEVIQEAGLSISQGKALGLYLQNLRVAFDPPRNSDAASAGFKRNDRILKVNDTAVATAEQLARVLEPLKLGEKVTIQVARKGQEGPLQMELPVVEGEFSISVKADATDNQKALLKGWLAPSK